MHQGSSSLPTVPFPAGTPPRRPYVITQPSSATSARLFDDPILHTQPSLWKPELHLSEVAEVSEAHQNAHLMPELGVHIAQTDDLPLTDGKVPEWR